MNVSGKTNAMRVLDKNKIPYKSYRFNPDHVKSMVDLAEAIDRPLNIVYKTLVTHHRNNLYVFVIPLDKELDLKKAAKVVGEKNVELIDVNDLQKYTGYVRGGCSPIGMRKSYPTCIDESAKALSTIIVSAGKRGMQVELNPEQLAEVVSGQFADLTKG